MAAFSSNLNAIISSASIVYYADSLCVLDAGFMGSLFRMEKNPDVGLWVYTKAGDFASGC